MLKSLSLGWIILCVTLLRPNPSDMEKDLFEQELEKFELNEELEIDDGKAKHIYERHVSVINEQIRRKTESLRCKAEFLKNSGRPKKALQIIKEAIGSLISTNPSDYELRTKLDLTLEECCKAVSDISRRPTIRIEGAIEREKILTKILSHNPLRFCLDNGIYEKLAEALIDQAEPMYDMPAKSAEKAIGKLDRYSEILKNEAPDDYRAREAGINKLKDKALYQIHYEICLEARQLIKSGLSIAAAELLSKIPKTSPLYKGDITEQIYVRYGVITGSRDQLEHFGNHL